MADIFDIYLLEAVVNGILLGGLLALLDNRILKKAYGRMFIESLPSYRKTTELGVVEEFFGMV